MKSSVAAFAAVAALTYATVVAADVQMKIGPVATALKGGTTVQVPVSTRCDPDTPELLEAFMTLNQDIFGDGPVHVGPCDGEWHSSLSQVTGYDGVFRPGPAFASGYLLFCDETGSFCPSAGATREITIRKSKRFFKPKRQP